MVPRWVPAPRHLQALFLLSLGVAPSAFSQAGVPQIQVYSIEAALTPGGDPSRQLDNMGIAWPQHRSRGLHSRCAAAVAAKKRLRLAKGILHTKFDGGSNKS